MRVIFLFLFFCTTILHSEIILQENFSGSQLPNWIVKKGNWEVKNGIISETTGNFGSIIFTDKTKKEITDFEVVLRYRINELTNMKDHILGVSVKGIWTQIRPQSIVSVFIDNISGKRKITESAGAHWAKNEIGKWYTFHIVFRKEKIDFYRDGIYLYAMKSFHKDEPLLSLTTYGIKGSFKDILVISIPESKEKKVKESKNLLMNADLEISTNKDLPDGWGASGRPYSFIPNTEQFLYDNTEKYSGNYSVRLGKDMNFAQLYGDQIKEDTFYTFSAYMKSNEDKANVLLGMLVSYPKGRKWIQKKVTVGKKWKRYTWTFKPNFSPIRINFSNKSQGYVWIDAIQFEEGEKATPFRTNPEKDSIFKGVKKEKKIPIQVPKYKVPLVKIPPVINGDLNEKCWEKAQKIELIQYNNGKPATQKTISYLLRDERNLYIGFHCSEKHPEKVKAIKKERDSTVWSDDSIEIFLDPELTQEKYYHFSCNTIGTQYDSFCNAPFLCDAKWDGVWNVKCKKGRDFWSMEIVIPFSNFYITSSTSDWWGINLCRNDIQHNEYLCSFPTITSFHNAKRYSQVYLVDNYVRKAHPLTIKDMKLLPAGKQFSYYLSFTIENTEKNLKDIDIHLNIFEGLDKIFEKEKKIHRVNNKEIFHIGPFFLKKSIAHIIIKCWQKGNLLLINDRKLHAPDILDTYFSLSFYSNEKDAELIYKINLENLKKTKLYVKISPKEKPEKAVLSLKVKPNNSGVIKIPLRKLDYGKYIATTQLLQKRKIISSSESLLIFLPKKENEVKIDRRRRCLTVNGKPFLVFAYSLSNFKPLGEDVISYQRKLGMESLLIWGFRPGRSEKEDLDFCQKYNIKVIPYIATLLNEKGEKEVIKRIEKYKEHPAILMWFVLDEPLSQTPEVVENRVKLVKKVDPHHPTWVNYTPPGIRKFLEVNSDVISTDYYWNPPALGRTCASQGLFVKEMMKLGELKRKVVFIFLQSYGAYGKLREPTPLEQEGQTYLSIIEGARGIVYFVNVPASKYQREKITSLYKELKVLSPALFSIESVPEISVNKKPIRYTLKKDGENWYLITVNSGDVPVEARFELSSLNLKNEITGEVLFEKRKIKIKRNILSDSYLPYQRHVYKIPQKNVLKRKNGLNQDD